MKVEEEVMDGTSLYKQYGFRTYKCINWRNQIEIQRWRQVAKQICVTEIEGNRTFQGRCLVDSPTFKFDQKCKFLAATWPLGSGVAAWR